MSESKSQSIFPLWESLGKLNHRSFTRTGPLRPDWSLIVPTPRDSGSTFGSSSALVNAARYLSLTVVRSAQTLATLFVASRSNPIPLTSPSFRLPLGGSSAYIPCSLKIRSDICKEDLRDGHSV